MQTVDAQGLKCPLPVIALQKAVRTAKPGERIQIIATDPGVCQDIPSWCRINKHTLIEQRAEQDRYFFILEVKG
jgi:tRNA 2-thiouridine synthesizing protein A